MAKEIHEYDLNGRYIQSFGCIARAADFHQRDESLIRKAANKEGTAVYRLWSYHKRSSYYDTDTIDDIITSHNIPPEEVTKTRLNVNTKGEESYSIETRRKQEIDPEDIRTNFVLGQMKLLQRKTDELRVIKKEFRENSRVENTLTVLNEKLNKLLNSQSFKPSTYNHPVQVEGSVIIVQLSDLHFNELVTLPDNLYDFNVAAKRLQKYAHKIRKIVEIYKPSNIVLALTGDIINSDRRLDEMMNMSTNRMKASLLATQLIFHFIQDINRCSNITIVSVSGNESRVKLEHGMSELLMSDNYDYLIYNMLKMLFKESIGISFIDGDPVEQVINVNNSNVLITHGTSIKEGQAAMQQIFGKYAAKGILLDYAIFGHIHFTNITDIYSRSGSLIGNNVYSDRHLNLITKASQVVHIFELDGTIDSIKVGLQYVDNYKGYDIDDDYNTYNPILASNTKERETIVQVVI